MSLAGRMREWLGRRPSGVSSADASADAPDAAAADAAAVQVEYQRLLAALEGVRRASADVRMTRRKLQAQADDIGRAHDDLQARARLAAGEGRDDLARSALAEALQLERRLADRQKVIDGLGSKEKELGASSERLQLHIEAYRVRMEAAHAGGAAAAARAEAEAAAAEDRRRRE
jgi:phage shock protein A